jgi:hypothetical protein
MSTDLMRPIRWVEKRGADRWRDDYPMRAEYGDRVADLYGIARMWRRITGWTYLVAIALMVLPVGGALRYVGVLIWTLGLLPLITWLAQRFFFRKAVKLATEQKR